MIDLAIVNYGTDFYLLNLLRSIGRHAGAVVGTVHVWENGSADRSAAVLARMRGRMPNLRAYLSPTNVHHGPALDALLRHGCRTEWVLLLDADTELRCDFTAALPWRLMEGAAFVGQISPHAPQLYAYLAHLLIHRPSYLALPPFRHDGAPGLDFFQAVEISRRPYVRFRWTDFVSHYGQGSLRALYARGERRHEFYGFAADQSRRYPAPAERAELEARLRRDVTRFLEEAPEPPAGALPVPAPTVAPPRRRRTNPRRAPGLLRDAIQHLTDARASAWIRQARRLGLVQKPREIRALVRLIRALRPERVLEIGTSHGGSFYLWTRVAAGDATLISIDLPPWEVDDPFEPIKVASLKRLARPAQTVHLLRRDSHDPSTRHEVERILAGAPLDLLFVDGDHSYEGVTRDLADYGPLVRQGGLIALHDIHPHSKGWGGDVPAVWHQIRTRHPHLELVADPRQDGFGIGVLQADRPFAS